MPEQKELYFFDSDLWGNRKWAPTLEEYLNHFAQAADEKKVGEATPSYLRSPHAAKEIRTFSPEAQIIIMLRNPLDVMYSLHSKALDGPEPIGDFGEALKADEGRTGRELIGYREFTDFPNQVQRYFDLFGRENVHTIIYDELKANSATVCQSVLRFLDVRLDFAADFPWIHLNKQLRSTQLQTLLVRPPQSLRHIWSALAPQRLRCRIRRTLLNSNWVVRPRTPMDPALRRRLQKECEAKVERLSRMLDRDLSAWCNDLPSKSEIKATINV
jgi:hypothetical protein